MPKENPYIEAEKRIVNCLEKRSRKLDLSNLGIAELSKLKRLRECTHLEWLDFSKNQITEIKNLEQFTNLRLLNFAFNQITEIKNLEKLNNLQSIGLTHNQITESKQPPLKTVALVTELGQSPITARSLFTMFIVLQIISYHFRS